jgi:hypothetical protein
VYLSLLNYCKRNRKHSICIKDTTPKGVIFFTNLYPLPLMNYSKHKANRGLRARPTLLGQHELPAKQYHT